MRAAALAMACFAYACDGRRLSMMTVGLDEEHNESQKESSATPTSPARLDGLRSNRRVGTSGNPLRALATLFCAFNHPVSGYEGLAYGHHLGRLVRSSADCSARPSAHIRGHHGIAQQRAQVSMQLLKDQVPTDSKDLALLQRQLAETDKNLSDLDNQIASLRQERASLQEKRNSISDIVDEARFEVSTWSDWNGPILSTLFGAALTAVLWQDIRAISALAYYNSIMEADWFPEAIKLLARLPADLLTKYGQFAGSEDLTTILTTKACTSAVSYLLGDLLAQVFEGRNRPRLLDLPRAARNTALGFFLHGPVLHYWILWEEGPVASLAGGNDNPAAVFLKILLDQTMFASFINLAYATLDELLADSSLSESFAVARQVLVPSVVASWRFWPFVHLLSYSPLIPLDFKLLWIDTMEIVWVAILSTTVNAGKSPDVTESSEELKPLPWGEGRFQLIKDRAEAFSDWMGGISQDETDSMVQKDDKRRESRRDKISEIEKR
mmetsp:Transcript_118198/g.217660  ORF Transcript_118198/g.217660 Transcript_118198/m.217660 type:complete len:497 (-) Transcript_118198:179-1669(-)